MHFQTICSTGIVWSTPDTGNVVADRSHHMSVFDNTSHQPPLSTHQIPAGDAFDRQDPRAVIRVEVDAEWRILRGVNKLAARLELDEELVATSSIGRLLHPDDLTISPYRISRRPIPTSLRFRHGRYGFVRVETSISGSGDAWQMCLRQVDARIFNIDRGC